MDKITPQERAVMALDRAIKELMTQREALMSTLPSRPKPVWTPVENPNKRKKKI